MQMKYFIHTIVELIRTFNENEEERFAYLYYSYYNKSIARDEKKELFINENFHPKHIYSLHCLFYTDTVNDFYILTFNNLLVNDYKKDIDIIEKDGNEIIRVLLYISKIFSPKKLIHNLCSKLNSKFHSICGNIIRSIPGIIYIELEPDT